MFTCCWARNFCSVFTPFSPTCRFFSSYFSGTKKNAYIAGIAVLSSYLFCTPRKWIGTAVSSLWNYSGAVSDLVQILVTVPLLLIILKYVTPYVVRLKYEHNRILQLLIAVPLGYYVLEYTLTVYTDLLYRSGARLVEFMDAVVVTLYFIFSVIYLKALYEKEKAEVEQAMFRIMADQSKAEIEALQESEKQASLYRHDLRHHLNYLYSCLEENNVSQARAYIAKVNDGLDNSRVVSFCENHSVNLILSSYAAKAANQKITCDIQILTDTFGQISEPDLCSLLANGMENAVNCCAALADQQNRRIRLRAYTKNNKLCIDLRNVCPEKPAFYYGFPWTKVPGHGYGTKSMANVVEKYSGIWRFYWEDGWFIFQATT